MSRRSFKIDIKGFGNEVMKADFMAELVSETATEIQQKAGDGYEASFTMGRKRALGMVWAETYDAKKDDYENNTLLKAAYPLKVVEK